VSEKPASPDNALVTLLPALISSIPRLLADVSTELGDVSPEYVAVLADRDDEVVAAAVAAMRRLVAQAAQGGAGVQGPDPEGPAVQALFETVGRQQWRAGYPLPTLLGAFQAGARVAWRYVSEMALAADVPPVVLAALGGAVFQLVDQLSSASAAGYVAEQEEAGMAQQRLRDDLVQLLLSDRSDTAAVQLAARRAGWPLPDTATVVLAGIQDEPSRSALSRLEPGGLRFRTRASEGVVVPGPAAGERRERLARLLAGCAAVVGPTVALEHLPLSARIAGVAADLRRTGVLRDSPVFVDDHLGSLIVHGEPRLLEALRRRRLAPLEAAAPGVRATLRDTLRSWLVHMGDSRQVAADLQVHPQTVRYRLARLRELFGPELEDPRVRVELLLALAWD
jgi:hypothetical protein